MLEEPRRKKKTVLVEPEYAELKEEVEFGVKIKSRALGYDKIENKKELRSILEKDHFSEKNIERNIERNVEAEKGYWITCIERCLQSDNLISHSKQIGYYSFFKYEPLLEDSNGLFLHKLEWDLAREKYTVCSNLKDNDELYLSLLEELKNKSRKTFLRFQTTNPIDMDLIGAKSDGEDDDDIRLEYYINKN